MRELRDTPAPYGLQRACQVLRGPLAQGADSLPRVRHPDAHMGARAGCVVMNTHQPTRREVEVELIERYGRALPYGTVEVGDASERCLVCSLRKRGETFYVWLPGPMPVCSLHHAGKLRRHLEQRRLPGV